MGGARVHLREVSLSGGLAVLYFLSYKLTGSCIFSVFFLSNDAQMRKKKEGKETKDMLYII